MNLITALGAHCLFDNNLEAFNINPNSRINSLPSVSSPYGS